MNTIVIKIKGTIPSVAIFLRLSFGTFLAMLLPTTKEMMYRTIVRSRAIPTEVP